MSYCADKLIIDTHTDTQTDVSNSNTDYTRRPKLASGENAAQLK